MKTATFVAAVFCLLPTADGSEDLFNLLDANGDGTVTASEISPAQKPYFVRALRVSDRNEDGALTRQELTAATTDPNPTQVVAPGQNRMRAMANFDPARFDANKDGKIAKSEIPASLRARTAPLFERFGSDAIAVEDLKRILSYAAPQQAGSSAKRMREESKREAAPADSARQGGTMMQKLRQRMQGQQRQGRSEASDASAEDTFKRLDRNSDGMLKGNEISARMKLGLRRFDRNDDQSLSLTEFRKMVETYRRQRRDDK